MTGRLGYCHWIALFEKPFSNSYVPPILQNHFQTSTSFKTHFSAANLKLALKHIQVSDSVAITFSVRMAWRGCVRVFTTHFSGGCAHCHFHFCRRAPSFLPACSGSCWLLMWYECDVMWCDGYRWMMWSAYQTTFHEMRVLEMGLAKMGFIGAPSSPNSVFGPDLWYSGFSQSSPSHFLRSLSNSAVCIIFTLFFIDVLLFCLISLFCTLVHAMPCSRADRTCAYVVRTHVTNMDLVFT